MANLRVDKITSTETFETTGSVQFDGSSGTSLTVSNTASMIGTNDFTVEFFIYSNSTADRRVFSLGANNADGSFVIMKDEDGIRVNWETITSTGGDLSVVGGGWHHVAAVRRSNNLKVYIDGKLDKDHGIVSVDFDANTLQIGDDSTLSNQELTAHISNLRVVQLALYTENFTPPTKELTVTPETVLLCCQHKTDASHEKTGKTITVNGNAVANELTPGLLTDVVKSGGNSAITGSVEFDGTGDYLSVTPTDDFELGSDDFTIEAWVYSSNWKASLANTIFSKGNSSSVSTEFYSLQATQTAGRVQFFWRSGSALLDGSNTRNLSTDSWNHVAVTRSGDTFNLYINGILDDTTTSSTTLDTGVTGGVLVGAQSFDPTNNNRLLTGNISNLRVIKGTALYTDNFIPPTRELKKVPGTVLLCCQDPNDPTTEATGKTITGHGDLQKADGVELVTNGHFNANTDNWTAAGSTLSVSSGALRVTKDGAGRAEANQAFTTVAGNIYRVYFDLITDSTAADIRVEVFNDSDSAVLHAPGGNLSVGNKQTFIFTATSSTSRIELAIASGGSASEFAEFDNVSVTLAETRNGASNFTPQVGNDDSVEFVGPTKINTENYFYLPTGDTITRDSRSGRAVFGGGTASPGSSNLNSIEYITIQTLGNATDFGDLLVATRTKGGGGVASYTRGITGGGFDSGNVSRVEYITFATTGNAVNFDGTLGTAGRNLGSASNSTRGIFAGGDNRLTAIDFLTIASTGTVSSFGSLPSPGRSNLTGCASPTRALFGGGYSGGALNTIEYVTIASTGNALDFGDLSVARFDPAACSSPTRGIFAGGSNPTPTQFNTIDYITIASTGQAQDFGDIITAQHNPGGTSNSIRGVFAGGSPAFVNAIEFVTIASTGDAKDFGDLITSRGQAWSCSDSHGGLG